jgi:crotonobetainyl-CoA:carnitine CoA-transferase CaiB-like acyl-CoA transferase
VSDVEHGPTGGPAVSAEDLPLAGIRVLDLTRALSGPFCTLLLGDLGADIVKVESLGGEVCRQWGPWQGSESLYFLAANRNKRGISLDMWSEEGRELLRTMAGHFDVVVENFRPGVLDALGLGKDWVAEHHPDLVVASVSGFGHVGPQANEACFDQVALGMGGLMSITGSEESGPMRSGIPLADTLTGIFAALGICAALVGRRPGRTVQTSLLESVIGVLTFQGQRYLSLGEVPERAGNDHPVVVPYGVFRTADRPINLAAGTGPQWVSLCEVIGAPELATDERFATPQDRIRNKRELVDTIEARFVQQGADEWLNVLAAAHIPSGPINDMAQTFSEPQVQALGVVQQVEHASLGSVTMARGPLWIDGRPTSLRRAAPVLGQHTIEVLEECGYSHEAIRGFVKRGVVNAAEVAAPA